MGARNPSYLKLPKLKGKILLCLEDEPELQLVDGSERCSGRMEILHQGAWSTVCDELWDLNEAGVMCWQLGWGRAIAAPRKGPLQPGLWRHPPGQPAEFGEREPEPPWPVPQFRLVRPQLWSP